MKKTLICTETAGVVFTAVCAAAGRHLYALSGGELTGILFGAVNNSPWERSKVLLLPYLLWAVLEVMTLRRQVCRLAVAKTAALYVLGAVSLLLSPLPPLIASVISLIAATAACLLLFFSPLPLHHFFTAAVCLLFLFLALYFSLTPFPPQNPLFCDPQTGIYGIPTRLL